MFSETGNMIPFANSSATNVHVISGNEPLAITRCLRNIHYDGSLFEDILRVLHVASLFFYAFNRDMSHILEFFMIFNVIILIAWVIMIFLKMLRDYGGPEKEYKE
jgi:hypothetical protein